MLEKRKKMADKQVVDILFPVAVLCTVVGEAYAVRVARCRVRCNSYKLCRHKTPYFAYCFEDIDIAAIEQATITEISLIDLSKYKGLRERLLHTEQGIVYLRGTNAIAYAFDNGRVINAGVYQSLITHTHRNGEGYVTFHGYWDYTGTWHAGVKDLPMRFPYIEELQELNIALFKDICIEELLERNRTDEILSTLGSKSETIYAVLLERANGLRLSEAEVQLSMSCTCEDKGNAAAKALMGITEGALRMIVGTLTYIPYMPLGDTVLVPGEAKGLRLLKPAVRNVGVQHANRVRAGNGIQTGTDLRLACICIPETLKVISIDVTDMPAIRGIQNSVLAMYDVCCDTMTGYALPRAMRSDVQYKYTRFCLVVRKAVKFHCDMLDIQSLMLDAQMATINVTGQPWDTVILPTTTRATSYAGTVEQSSFNIGVLPGKLNGCIASEMRQEALIGLSFLDNNVLSKQANINLRALTAWRKLDITAQTQAESGKSISADVKNRVLLQLGMPCKNVAVDADTSGATLIYSTENAIIDEITAPVIPTLICYIRRNSVKLDAEHFQSGAMQIKAAVNNLVLCLDESGRTDMVKDIYITGEVGTIQVIALELSRADVTACMQRVHIHLRKELPKPKLLQPNTVDIRQVGSVMVYNKDGVDILGRLYNRNCDIMLTPAEVSQLITFE